MFLHIIDRISISFEAIYLNLRSITLISTMKLFWNWQKLSKNCLLGQTTILNPVENYEKHTLFTKMLQQQCNMVVWSYGFSWRSFSLVDGSTDCWQKTKKKLNGIKSKRHWLTTEPYCLYCLVRDLVFYSIMPDNLIRLLSQWTST